ncbi:MAG TPA: hypothetical protein VD926_04285 [Acidimicrobiales bacterium]|nr:hypothetical protein [Acidimicrobiales bacterium]
MEPTADAEALFERLAAVAPAEDVAEIRTAASLEAARLRHGVVVPGHVLTVLVRGGADAGLLPELGVGPEVTPAQLADRTRAEVDAHAASPAGQAKAAETLVIGGRARRQQSESEPCPECGDTGERRHETRRVPSPGGGRGSTTARIVVCARCGTAIGPG